MGNDSSPSCVFPPLTNASGFHYLIWKIKRDFCTKPLEYETQPGNSDTFPERVSSNRNDETIHSRSCLMKEQLSQTEARYKTMPGLLQVLHREFLLLFNDL